MRMPPVQVKRPVMVGEPVPTEQVSPSAVTEELTKLTGVHEVSIDLNAGGTSAVRVTSEAALDDAA